MYLVGTYPGLLRSAQIHGYPKSSDLAISMESLNLVYPVLSTYGQVLTHPGQVLNCIIQSRSSGPLMYLARAGQDLLRWVPQAGYPTPWGVQIQGPKYSDIRPKRPMSEPCT